MDLILDNSQTSLEKVLENSRILFCTHSPSDNQQIIRAELAKTQAKSILMLCDTDSHRLFLKEDLKEFGKKPIDFQCFSLFTYRYLTKYANCFTKAGINAGRRQFATLEEKEDAISKLKKDAFPDLTLSRIYKELYKLNNDIDFPESGELQEYKKLLHGKNLLEIYEINYAFAKLIMADIPYWSNKFENYDLIIVDGIEYLNQAQFIILQALLDKAKQKMLLADAPCLEKNKKKYFPSLSKYLKVETVVSINSPISRLAADIVGLESSSQLISDKPLPIIMTCHDVQNENRALLLKIKQALAGDKKDDIAVIYPISTDNIGKIFNVLRDEEKIGYNFSFFQKDVWVLNPLFSIIKVLAQCPSADDVVQTFNFPVPCLDSPKFLVVLNKVYKAKYSIDIFDNKKWSSVLSKKEGFVIDEALFLSRYSHLEKNCRSKKNLLLLIQEYRDEINKKFSFSADTKETGHLLKQKHYLELFARITSNFATDISIYDKETIAILDINFKQSLTFPDNSPLIPDMPLPKSPKYGINFMPAKLYRDQKFKHVIITDLEKFFENDDTRYLLYRVINCAEEKIDLITTDDSILKNFNSNHYKKTKAVARMVDTPAEVLSEKIKSIDFDETLLDSNLNVAFDYLCLKKDIFKNKKLVILGAQESIFRNNSIRDIFVSVGLCEDNIERFDFYGKNLSGNHQIFRTEDYRNRSDFLGIIIGPVDHCLPGSKQTNVASEIAKMAIPSTSNKISGSQLSVNSLKKGLLILGFKYLKNNKL